MNDLGVIGTRDVVAWRGGGLARARRGLRLRMSKRFRESLLSRISRHRPGELLGQLRLEACLCVGLGGMNNKVGMVLCGRVSPQLLLCQSCGGRSAFSLTPT